MRTTEPAAAECGASYRALASFAKGAGALAAMAVIFLTGTAMAASDTMSPMVAVPAPDSGSQFNGCYRIQGTIYDKYRMSFCLSKGGGGNYQVSGGGLNCKGGLDWYDLKSGKAEVDLYRSKCGKGQAWTGDSLACQAKKPRVAVKAAGIDVKVPIPGQKRNYDALNCTYNPVAGGYKPIKVTANRT